MKIIVLTESDLRKSVRFDQEAIAEIEDAFSMLSTDVVTNPLIVNIEVPLYEGDVDIKSAYVRGLENFTVKIGAGFFNNYRLGLSNSPAMMVVVSAKTVFAKSVLLDNAYLTDTRLRIQRLSRWH